MSENILASSNNPRVKITAEHIDFFYGNTQTLFDVNLSFEDRQVTALIGPSGCGKSTFLRTLSRMNELIPGTSIKGTISLDGQDVYDKSFDVVSLRQRVGMVFQRPTPFPKSIFENVAYGLRVAGITSRSLIADKVEESLRRAALSMRSRIASMKVPSDCPAVSNNAFASPAPWRLSLKFFSWMNQPALWTQLQPSA